MTRLTLAAAALLALTGCYDFTGEAGRLGFASDARIAGAVPWTPAHALAEGAAPRIAVTEVIHTGEEPASVRLTTARSITATPDDDAFVLRGDDGWIGAEADGVTDDLRVRWRKARRAGFLEPAPALGGEIHALDEVGVLEDRPTALGFALADGAGRPLGYVPEQLEVRVEGPLTASTEDGLSVTATGPATLVVGWPGGPSAVLRVVPVRPGAIDRVEVTEHRDDEGCAAVARAFAGDLPVLAEDGFRWAHTEAEGPVVECADDGPTPAPVR